MKGTKQGYNVTVSFILLGLRAEHIFYLGRRALACVGLIVEQGLQRISNVHFCELVPQF